MMLLVTFSLSVRITSKQGDQMSSKKIAQSVAKTIFGKK
jgi:hypothetical protein